MTGAAGTPGVADVAGLRRHPPKLVVLIAYEEIPRIQLYAIGADDRARMVGWLNRSGILERLPLALDDFLENRGTS